LEETKLGDINHIVEKNKIVISNYSLRPEYRGALTTFFFRRRWRLLSPASGSKPLFFSLSLLLS